MITKDDGYDSARTIPLVDELIDSEKVFMVWTLGSPNTMKTYDKLNQRCIPQTFSLTGHPAWGDPVNHPWTTGLALSYTSEAILLGVFIEKRVDELLARDGKITVGALVMNNDFGKAYDLGFKSYLASSAIKDKIDYQPELIEPSAPTITDPMTTIASKNPEVFIAMTAGTSCTQAYTEAAQNGLKEKAQYLLTTQPCKGSSFVGKDKVGGDGSASNGWWIAGGGNIDGNASSEDNNPYFVWGRDLLAKAGYDYKASGSFLLGLNYSWPFWQALQIAGELERRPQPHEPDAGRPLDGHDEPEPDPRHRVQPERQQGLLPDRGLRDRPLRLRPADTGSSRATSSRCPASRPTAPGTRRRVLRCKGAPG